MVFLLRPRKRRSWLWLKDEESVCISSRVADLPRITFESVASFVCQIIRAEEVAIEEWAMLESEGGRMSRITEAGRVVIEIMFDNTDAFPALSFDLIAK